MNIPVPTEEGMGTGIILLIALTGIAGISLFHVVEKHKVKKHMETCLHGDICFDEFHERRAHPRVTDDASELFIG